MPISTKALILTLIVLNAGWLYNIYKNKAQTPQSSRSYPLLSKRIFVDNPNDIVINFVSLRKKIEARFANLDARYSFYFEYLPDGTAIRIGDENELVAASLTKLPYVMDLYRASELGKLNLDDEVTIKKEWIDQRTGILWQRGEGAKITHREAAKLALTYSDNTAIAIVRATTSGLIDEEQETFADTDVEIIREKDLLLINAESFSSILKCLYFSCHLTRANSHEILTFMTQSQFNDRITRYLPKDIPVAHKIGNFARILSTSDCGIVYAPKRPYILCVMVGLPEQEANKLIAEISKEIFDSIVKLDI